MKFSIPYLDVITPKNVRIQKLKYHRRWNSNGRGTRYEVIVFFS
jgi:hypothetical protein